MGEGEKDKYTRAGSKKPSQLTRSRSEAGVARTGHLSSGLREVLYTYIYIYIYIYRHMCTYIYIYI